MLWAPLGAGTHYWGPGTSAFRLYKSVKEKNIYLTIVHASNQQGYFPEVFDEHVKLPVIEKGSLIEILKYYFAARRWLRLNHQRFDVFHGLSAFEYTFRPALLFCKTGKPAFIKITGEHYGFGQHSLLSRLLGIARSRRKNANRITGYIAISDAIETNLISSGIEKERIFKIPNSVNENIFTKIGLKEKTFLRKRFGIKERKTLLFVGGLSERKRPLECVLATHELIQKGFDVQLYIVGPDRSSNGRLLNKIIGYVKNNELDDRIYLVKETTKPELYYRLADIFLLPSTNEGMPNSLLEAMSSGLASVVTPVSGCRDLIDDGNNGIFTNGMVDDIVIKIQTLLENSQLAKNIGRNASRLIREKYSSERIFKAHIELFSQKF